MIHVSVTGMPSLYNPCTYHRCPHAMHITQGCPHSMIHASIKRIPSLHDPYTYHRDALTPCIYHRDALIPWFTYLSQGCPHSMIHAPIHFMWPPIPKSLSRIFILSIPCDLGRLSHVNIVCIFYAFIIYDRYISYRPNNWHMLPNSFCVFIPLSIKDHVTGFFTCHTFPATLLKFMMPLIIK